MYVSANEKSVSLNLHRYTVVNPDGYERTYVSTLEEPADRFWRKNTRPTAAGEDDSCIGVGLYKLNAGDPQRLKAPGCFHH
jgi:hypothetical protein